MFHAVFGTLIGHLNHANLNWDYGPLRFLLNNPRMHLWHHDHDGTAKTTVNFGIIFSCWDYLFRTARVPDGPPDRLGFEGVADFPRDFFTQATWPLPRLFPKARWAHLVLAAGGVSLLTFGWLVGTGHLFGGNS
jgi:sterol desaturase/sphingolipid hydroxylase (fatty acid hydroxylase superfamily)